MFRCIVPLNPVQARGFLRNTPPAISDSICPIVSSRSFSRGGTRHTATRTRRTVDRMTSALTRSNPPVNQPIPSQVSRSAPSAERAKGNPDQAGDAGEDRDIFTLFIMPV